MIKIIFQKVQNEKEIGDSMFNITGDGKILTMIIQSDLSNLEIENIFKNISVEDWKFNNLKESGTEVKKMDMNQNTISTVREIQFIK